VSPTFPFSTQNLLYWKRNVSRTKHRIYGEKGLRSAAHFAGEKN
jgi:hypothetical protein